MGRPVLLSIAAATIACADKPPDTAAVAARASGAADTGDTITQRGVWSDSVTAESEFVATYVNGALVVVEEQMRFSDGMQSARRYRYDSTQRLVQISEQRTLSAASGNSSPTLMRSQADVYLTGDRVDSSAKSVDLAPAALQPYDIDNLRIHERLIAARVSKTYIAP